MPLDRTPKPNQPSDRLAQNNILRLHHRPIPQNPRRRRILVFRISQLGIESNSTVIPREDRQHDFLGRRDGFPDRHKMLHECFA